MQVRFVTSRPEGAHALAIPVENAAADDARLPANAKPLIAGVAKAQRFEGDAASVAELFVASGAGAIQRLLLVGLGKDRGAADLPQRIGGALTARLLCSGEKTLVVDLTGLGLDGDAAARVGLGATLRAYRHDRYRTKLKASQRPSLEELVIVTDAPGAEEAWARHAAVAEGVYLTRDLVTEPANIIYPESFVDRCREALEGTGVEITVLEPEELERQGMGALLGVAQGAARPARLLAMRWNGGAEGSPPIALVGKGVTFDTGGISIKPAAGMEDMKWDMGGAGAVAGAMLAIARRRAPVNVVGVCGLVENMPDGKAQRPGDVVTSMSGQTIEIINTDAEGRLVLADAITWTQQTYGPTYLVDLATLTGAMIISLGHEYAGLFANDDGLANAIAAAGQATGDRVWRFPTDDAYDRLMDSPIADMKNSSVREGGSISAACFIKRFVVEGTKWAHLDIAGMVWAAKATHLWDKGATGYGVRLLDRLVDDLAQARAT